MSTLAPESERRHANPNATQTTVRWCVTDPVDSLEFSRHLHSLSYEERTRADRYVFSQDRINFVVARGLVRNLLSTYEPVSPSCWAFDVMSGGKPVLKQADGRRQLAFNLSHCDGLAAGVVSTGSSVGLDVESILRTRLPLQLAARFFSSKEFCWLSSCPEAEQRTRFIELWVLKEAYIKATGAGLVKPLHSFSFDLDEPALIRFQLSDRGSDQAAWRFALFAPTAHHRLAVAVESSAEHWAEAISCSNNSDDYLAPLRLSTE